jgi:hypothetical protein
MCIVIKKGPEWGLLSFWMPFGLSATLFDTGRLTGALTLVEDACATYFTTLVHLDFLQVRHVYGEDTLHADVARHFTDSKGFCYTRAAALKHVAAEELRTRLFTFTNFVVHRNGITRLKAGELLGLYILFLDVFNQVHGSCI